MIDHSRKAVFVHIPKTAGTSIKKVLGHVSEHDLASSVDSNIWKKYFTFAVVRNPYERLVSHYIFHRDHYRGEFFKKYVPAPNIHKMSFVEYIKLIKEHNKNVTNFRSQFEFITHPSGVPIDLICRFENLNEDWKKVQQKLSITTDLPITNKSDHKKYREYYNEETRNFVETFYKKDLDTFGYQF